MILNYPRISNSSSDYEEKIQIPSLIYSYYYTFVDDSSSISNSTMTSFSSTKRTNSSNISTTTLMSSLTLSSSSTKFNQIKEQLCNIKFRKNDNEVYMLLANSKQNNCIFLQRNQNKHDSCKDEHYVNDKDKREDDTKKEDFCYLTILHNISPTLDSDDEISINSDYFA